MALGGFEAAVSPVLGRKDEAEGGAKLRLTGHFYVTAGELRQFVAEGQPYPEPGRGGCGFAPNGRFLLYWIKTTQAPVAMGL